MKASGVAETLSGAAQPDPQGRLRRLRVGLTRHALTEPLGSSLHTVFASIEAVVRRHFSAVVPTELLCIPRQRWFNVARRLASEADVIVTTDPTFGVLRQKHKARFRLLYLPLGTMPRGAVSFRLLFPLLQEGDTVAFTSHADAAIFQRFVSSCRAQIAHLPLGVDTGLFRPPAKADRRRLREYCGLRDDDVLFVYAGRITAEKNVQTLLGVMGAVMRAEKNVHLLIAGAIQDVRFEEFSTGPQPLSGYFAQILEREPSLRSRSHFLGGVRNAALPLLFGAADVFINLTVHHDENFGYSQIEAMGCGLPVVCTDWGGLKDTVVPQAGFRIETKVCDRGVQVDRAAAYQACLRLARNPALRRAMGAAAREHVTKEFSRTVFERKFVSLIEKPGAPSGRANRLTSFGREFDRTFGRASSPHYPFERPTSPEYRLYRKLIAPYASEARGAHKTESGLVFVQPDFLDLRKAIARVRDPLWPREIPLRADECEVVAALRRRLRRGGGEFLPIVELRDDLRNMSGKRFRGALDRLTRVGILGTSPAGVAEMSDLTFG